MASSAEGVHDGEVVGAAEVAEILGVHVQNLSGPNAVKGLPEPFQRVRATRLWWRKDIEEFAQQRAARRKHNMPDRDLRAADNRRGRQHVG